MRKLEDENKRLSAKVASLMDALAWLRKRVYGQMSEKHLPVDPNQLNLFTKEEMSEMERKSVEQETEKEERTITRTITVKEKPARRDLNLEGLPVTEHHIYPEGTTDENGALKSDYVEIGTEESSRLELTPAKLCVAKTIRHKVILKSELEDKLPEERKIMIAPMLLMPVSKSMAGASVLADIIIGKFMYHLPFYRQIQQYKEHGISISASTMGGWYEAAVEKLKILYDTLRRQILQSEYIQIDENVILVLDDEKHKTRKGYEWCVRDGISGDVMFYYDRGRRDADVAKVLLGGYTGIAQSDGYAVYERYENVKGLTMCCCWAHARRKFVEALDEDNAMAGAAVGAIAQLYKVETDADNEGLTADERQRRRKEISYPIILEFEKWLIDSYDKVLPTSRMGKAIKYTYGHLPSLSNYVNDGRINLRSRHCVLADRYLQICRG